MNKTIAKFEKVSYKQFFADIKKLFPNTSEEEIELEYQNIILPYRSTVDSAGYDFTLTRDITIKSEEMLVIPSGIRAKIDSGFVLEIYPRSSLGIKKNLILANTVGIIDADYYYATNEGHILIALWNRGKQDVTLLKGERVTQGIFKAYYLAIEEEVTNIRIGGIGSSN